MRHCKPLVVILVLAFLVPTSRAWDATGHRVIAYIAWQQMTPEARQAVMDILKRAPVPSDLPSLFPRDRRPASVREMQYFMNAAVWPDIVRDRDQAVRYERYHHGPWHYTNIFWEHAADGSVRLREDIRPEDVNILERLERLDEMAEDARYPKPHRAVVIAWLEHLVGDIHQPLHTSARVTDQEPEGDRGGNLFGLEERDNLHWYWDRRLSDEMPRREDEGDVAYVRRLGEAVMEKYPAAELQAEVHDMAYEHWVERGFEIASTELYEGLTRGEAPPASYAEAAAATAERSIALAGYRLGALMNRLFG